MLVCMHWQGQWSDHAGRHFCLWISLVVCGLAYILVGLASTILLLLLARIPHGE